MDAALLTRKLRALRRLERRLSGGASPVFDSFFSFDRDARVKFPFTMLLVFDGESRAAAFRSFVDELWIGRLSGGTSGALATDRRSVLLQALDLPMDATPQEITRRFRERARELHPDLGGDHDLMVELLALRDESFLFEDD
ncbi:MAG: J domain-containing protein [Spirochaetaceae bacterium]|nr:MAG: J domain-containing protein [Spirochaetaceae bacterium]